MSSFFCDPNSTAYTGSFVTITITNTSSTSNYRGYYPYGAETVTVATDNLRFRDDLPKVEHDSVVQLRRMRELSVDPLVVRHLMHSDVRVYRARCPARFTHRARGKIAYWRSLKEKRMAWKIM